MPCNGDFTPFHEAGLVGLGLAMVGDAWAVHTRLDRLDHLQPGGMQHLGDATLATTRQLASAATPLVRTAEKVVFYDLLGFTMAPRLRVLSMLLALVPGLVVTIEVAVLAIANVVPMTGLLPPAAPGDVMIPLLVGLATCLIGVVALALPHLESGHG